jgi:hypothetical protein
MNAPSTSISLPASPTTEREPAPKLSATRFVLQSFRIVMMRWAAITLSSTIVCVVWGIWWPEGLHSYAEHYSACWYLSAINHGITIGVFGITTLRPRDLLCALGVMGLSFSMAISLKAWTENEFDTDSGWAWHVLISTGSLASLFLVIWVLWVVIEASRVPAMRNPHAAA